MKILKRLIVWFEKSLFKTKERDISNCFAPMTIVYHSGYDAYKKGWKE